MDTGDKEILDSLTEIFEQINKLPQWEYKTTITQQEAEIIQQETISMIRNID